tara:strand:+ start:1813 stop:2133 length:321 start_codon:yes stop_codon:yes gene_type:complete
MQPRIKKLLSVISGWSFIALGIIGLFLPFLQGILFLVIGLIILSKHYAFAQKWLKKIHHRYPAVFDLAHKFRMRLIERFLRGGNKATKDATLHTKPSEPRLMHHPD